MSNHDHALSFASGIVMVLTSPRAYNFNCAPQSSQYLYTISLTLEAADLIAYFPDLTGSVWTLKIYECGV